VLGEEVRRGLSGHGFSTERREERGLSSSEFPRWGNERADEPNTGASTGKSRDRTLFEIYVSREKSCLHQKIPLEIPGGLPIE
jgi:hypothetical protein